MQKNNANQVQIRAKTEMTLSFGTSSIQLRSLISSQPWLSTPVVTKLSLSLISVNYLYLSSN